MQHVSSDMKACIDACLDCYATCLSTAMGHCLTMGGVHTEPTHFTLMMSCVEACRTSAHLMLMGSAHHKETCRACAAICRDCAEDCARISDMDECVAACRRCAEHCERMAA